MIEIDVPGYGRLALSHLVLDYNGTLACDGDLLPGVPEALNRLARNLEVHVVTADTFGKVRQGMEGVSCTVTVLPREDRALARLRFVEELGAEATACVGNGRNDRLMLEAAALGIAVILGEGASREAVNAGDIVCTDILTALALLENPLRMTATLRS